MEEEEEKRIYKACESRVKKLIRNRKNAFEKQIAKDSKTNSKCFFSFINSGKRSRSSIGPLSGGDNELVTDPLQQAGLLNEYFSSVFTRSTTEPPTKDPTCIQSLDEVTVKDVIDQSREYSAPGPDDITSKLLIELKNEIAKPLATLFRKSLDEMKIPNDWRLSNVTPIYKMKGSKADPGNYRPVSLTSNICKLMERVINVELSNHLEKRVLNNTQHGFRKGRSCQTIMIEFMDKVTSWLDEGNSVDVLYVDFRKAFDKVEHKRLMVKLKAEGVGGKLWGWLKDWLSGRYQRVVVNGMMSEWALVESGVPQGTVLGGPLFTVFVKDLDEWIRAFLRKFADDTKAASIVNNQEDATRFQKDIDALMAWADCWAMEFNQAKCKIMHLGKNNQKFKYEMGGVELVKTEEERDLGVLVHESMKPANQCQTAAKNANRVLGLIHKSFHYRTKNTLIPLYKSLVRPKLEHAAAAWSPWLEKDSEPLEKVQRRLILMLSNVRGESYEEKLLDAGLTTLKERRKRGDLEAFKTLNGLNGVIKADWFEIDESNSTRPSTRSNTDVTESGGGERKTNVLLHERAKTEIRNQSFRFRTARAWNELPSWVTQAKSTNAFKNLYDRWQAKKPNIGVVGDQINSNET